LDSFSAGLADSLQGRKKVGFTFALEAGRERLRQVINKGLSDQALMETIEIAIAKGWASLKLYFMVGLPTETLDDVKSIVELVHRIRYLRGPSGRQLQVKVNASTFVPKAHTPFQWAAQNTEEELCSKHDILKHGVKRAGALLSWQDPHSSLLEAVLSRGDRRLGQVIYRAWQLGCIFDAWSEHFSYDKWQQAFDDQGLDPSFFAHRERPLSELLPWAHIDVGVRLAFLKREYQRAVTGQETPYCHQGACTACGLERWGEECQRKYKLLTAPI